MVGCSERCSSAVRSPSFPLVVTLFINNLVYVGTFKVVGICVNDMSRSMHTNSADIGFSLGLYSLVAATPAPGIVYILKRTPKQHRRFYPILGSVLVSMGICLASYSPNKQVMAFFFCVAGLGYGLVLVVSGVLLHEFSERFNSLYCLALSGAGIGMVLPPLIAELLLDSCGWRGSMLIYGALCGHIIPCAVAIRSGPKTRAKKYREIPSAASKDQELVHSEPTRTLEKVEETEKELLCATEHLTKKVERKIDEFEPTSDIFLQNFDKKGRGDHSYYPGETVLILNENSEHAEYSELSGDEREHESPNDEASAYFLRHRLTNLSHSQNNCALAQNYIHVADLDAKQAVEIMAQNGGVTHQNALEKVSEKEKIEMASLESNGTDLRKTDDDHHNVETRSGVWGMAFCTDPWVNCHVVSCLLFGGIFSGWHAFLIPHALQRGISPDHTIIIMAFCAVGNIGSRVCVSFITQKVSPTSLYLLFSIINAGTLYGYTFVTNIFSMAALSFVSAISLPNRASLIYLVPNDRVPAHQFPAVFAAIDVAFGMGAVIGGYVSGLVADRYSTFDASFMVLAALDSLVFLTTLPLKCAKIPKRT